MSERTGSVPLNRPQNEMLVHVEALLRRHQRLVEAWEAGWSFELMCDEDALWATLTSPQGARIAGARIDTPRWWLPSRSGRALALAEGLATDLQTAIESHP
jgi:hypothetical protein